MKLITVSILNMSKLIWWSLIAAPLCLSLSMSEFNVPEFAHFGKRVVLKVRIWMERYKSILSFRAMFECVYLFAEYCISVRAPVVIQWRAAGECEVVQGDHTIQYRIQLQTEKWRSLIFQIMNGGTRWVNFYTFTPGGLEKERKQTRHKMEGINILVKYLQGGPKKSVFSKNENRPWWGFFEKKIHDQ